MYALLQSKAPRLFSSAVAAEASFTIAPALSGSAWSISSFLGSALGQYGQFCYLLLCYWGWGTPKYKKVKKAAVAWKKDKQSHPPRMIISGDLPSRLRYESRAAHDKPGLCITQKDNTQVCNDENVCLVFSLCDKNLRKWLRGEDLFWLRGSFLSMLGEADITGGRARQRKAAHRVAVREQTERERCWERAG